MPAISQAWSTVMPGSTSIWRPSMVSFGIAERADRVAFDLAGDLLQQVDLRRRGVALHHPLHHPPHPAGPFAAGRALAAALMHVEMRQPGDRGDDVGRLVHDDDRG